MLYLQGLLSIIQGGPKDIVWLFFFLNEKLRFCFLIIFIWTFRIILVKSRRWYRPNGRRHNWLPYRLILRNFSSFWRELRATESRTRVKCYPWGLPESRACSRKHGTHKKSLKRSIAKTRDEATRERRLQNIGCGSRSVCRCSVLLEPHVPQS